MADMGTGFDMTREEEKEIIKEAIKEWLDDKFTALGKWTALTIGAAMLAAIIYLLLWANGFRLVQ